MWKTKYKTLAIKMTQLGTFGKQQRRLISEFTGKGGIQTRALIQLLKKDNSMGRTSK